MQCSGKVFANRKIEMYTSPVWCAMHRAGLTYFAKGSEAKVVSFRRAW